MQPKEDLEAISIKGQHGNGRNGASQDVDESQVLRNTIESLRAFAKDNQSGFGSVILDPPWRFANRTGKVAPEHRRLHRYSTMKVDQLAKLPVGDLVPKAGHIYLWCPNALLGEGLHLLAAWGLSPTKTKPCLAQDSQGWRIRWTRGRLLLSENVDRVGSFRCQGQIADT